MSTGWRSAHCHDLQWENIWRARRAPWPVQRRPNWLDHVNQPLTRTELLKLEQSLTRGRPFGSDKWIARTADTLGLQHTLRREGRPATKLPRSEKSDDKT